MNIYKFSTFVLNSSDKRPSVRLIVLYRALHACGLKRAYDMVKDLYPYDATYGRVRVEFLVDDSALGRLMYEIHNRHDQYTRPCIERMSAMSGYGIADSINLNILESNP